MIMELISVLPGSALVIYSTEITPDELAQQRRPLIGDGLAGLKEHLEHS